MPRPQAASADSLSDREQQIQLAEQEISSQEAQLQQEVARLRAASDELLGRLQQVKASTAQAQLAGMRAPGFAELHRRVHQMNLSALEVAPYVHAAMDARVQAIEARRRYAEKLRQTLQAHAAELARLSSQLTADEAALRQFEAAARQEATRREQTAPTISEPATPPVAQPAPQPSPAQTTPPPTSATLAQRRRAQPRVRMQAAVDLHSETNFFTGFSTNISEGGLFVATVQTLPIGTEVDLSFTLPGSQKIAVKGVVRWTREVNDQTPEIFPGIGIQFVNLDEQVAATLQQFVSTREPMFFPE